MFCCDGATSCSGVKKCEYEKRINAKKELKSLVGKTIQVNAGKSKNAIRMEWRIVDKHIPTTPLPKKMLEFF
jgi:hypothetical protein